MKNLFLIITFVIFALQINAQNIGQEGDTLLNYVDINGLKQGAWKKTYDNGTLLYETYFIDDKPVGDYKRYDKNGDIYAHLIHDSVTEFARAEFFHNNGKKAAVGNYLGKNKDSIWNYFDDSGILYLQESFKAGVKHGAFKKYTSEKILIEEIYWKYGAKEGSWKKFFTGGQIMWEANYIDNKLDGEAKSWFKSGKVYKEGVFRNDLMEGPWLKYKENGNLEKIYQYKKGVSPEADKENDKMMRELNKNKNQFEGPANANDLDWLRGKSRY